MNQYKTFKAGEVLAIHRMVYMSAADTVAYPTGVGVQPIGVTVSAAAAIGDKVEVQMFGFGKVEIGAAVAAYNAPLLYIAAADGQVDDVAAAAGTLHCWVGFSLSLSGTAGDIIDCLIMPGQGIRAHA